jgi:hypothetical protein
MYEKFVKISDKAFREGTGIKRETFMSLLGFLQEAHDLKKSMGGRPNLLRLEDQLMLWLDHMKDNLTYQKLAIHYDVSVGTVFSIINWVEDVLSKRKELELPGKEALLREEENVKEIAVDASEIRIERPKKDQGTYYSGKKKIIR